VETTEFSGAPQGDDSRPDATAPGAEMGFFAPAPTPTTAVATEPESVAPAEETAAESVVAPVEETAPSFDPTSFDPTSFDPGSLLAPEEAVPDTTAGLPMSLTIAAEEAATVDVDTAPEPAAFDYQAFHDGESILDDGAGDAGATAPASDVGPDVLAATAPEVSYESEPGSEYAQEFAAPEQVLELAETEAEEAAYTRVSTEPSLAGDEIVLVDLLLTMLERGASDLHITAGARPAIRVNGELTQMDEYPVLTPPVIQRVMYAAITQRQREVFEEELELDFAYSVPGRARFRVNMYRQRDSVGAAFRIIPFEIKKLEDLGVPTQVANFAALPRGFVLVTGPTGSGKSTTLASLLDLANRQRKEHIMTCEDPIEFLHRHQMSLVNQREVGEDTRAFKNALKHVLRQDPDIILVGEMRDLETIGVALTAAETGHLVYATLHTQDAAQTIDRVIDVFPPHQQQQVRAQLAQSLQGVVCQTLARTTDGKGRVVACEILVATPAIRNLIREGKTHQIYSAMQAGSKFGMQTMDQHLADLVNKGRITYETGVEKCHHIEDFNRLTGRG
jgi:twitching motility protein PilT